jgi:hypothetical protein
MYKLQYTLFHEGRHIKCHAWFEYKELLVHKIAQWTCEKFPYGLMGDDITYNLAAPRVHELPPLSLCWIGRQHHDYIWNGSTHRRRKVA